jgi:hypothetical protein
MSATTLNKRKIEEDSDDEDVQLFLKHESENSKKLKSKEEDKVEETAPQTPKQASKEVKTKGTPANNSLPTKNVNTPKLSVQTKLPFKTLQPSNLDKTAQATPPKTETKCESQYEVVPRADGQWFIEDFLLDKEWRSLLKDEFEKKYFIEINNVIRGGYDKNILRPPKELVFNALNSTKLKNV